MVMDEALTSYYWTINDDDDDDPRHMQLEMARLGAHPDHCLYIVVRQ